MVSRCVRGVGKLERKLVGRIWRRDAVIRRAEAKGAGGGRESGSQAAAAAYLLRHVARHANAMYMVRNMKRYIKLIAGYKARAVDGTISNLQQHHRVLATIVFKIQESCQRCSYLPDIRTCSMAYPQC